MSIMDIEYQSTLLDFNSENFNTITGGYEQFIGGTIELERNEIEKIEEISPFVMYGGKKEEYKEKRNKGSSKGSNFQEVQNKLLNTMIDIQKKTNL